MRTGMLLGLLSMVLSCLGLAINRNDAIIPELLNLPEVTKDKMSAAPTTKTSDTILSNETIPKKLGYVSNEVLHRLSMHGSLLDDPKELVMIPELDKSSKTRENPRNVVLVMVDDSAGTNSWQKSMRNYSFPVEGLFKSCMVQKTTNGSLSSLERNNCHCENLLKVIISNFMSWARLIQGMNTATVSEGNFTLPSDLDIENSLLPSINDNNPEVFRLKLNLGDSQRSVDVNGESTSFSSPSSPTSSAPEATEVLLKQDNANEGVWDFLNIISRIRLALFRNFLDSLRENAKYTNEGDTFAPKLSSRFALQSFSLAELIFNSLMNLNSVSKDTGFLLIAVVPSNQVSSTLKVIERETSKKETLVVISGLCSHNDNAIPFFASGPRSMSIASSQTLTDLLNTIKLVVDHSPGSCTVRGTSLALPLESLAAKKRVVRSEDEEIFLDEEKLNNGDVIDATSSSEATSEFTEGSNADEEFLVPKSDSAASEASGASYHQAKQLIMAFGILISIFAMFTLHM